MYTSWWLNHPFEKKMLVNMGSSSPQKKASTIKKHIWVASTQYHILLMKYVYNHPNGNLKL